MSICLMSLSWGTNYARINTRMTTRSSELRRKIRGAELKSANRSKNCSAAALTGLIVSLLLAGLMLVAAIPAMIRAAYRF